jgi:hypothetical protein
MRNGQNKHHRMRGRNRGGGGGGGGGKNHNPLTRVYESNGPDVKIRGTANHIAEKYIQLARDATGSGDPVAAENYYQHAEHYFRLIAAAQEQFRQNQPFQQQQQPQPRTDGNTDDGFDDGDDQSQSSAMEPHAPRDQQQQPYQQRDHQGGNNQQPRQHYNNNNNQQRYDRQDRGDRQDRHDNQPRQDHQPRFDNRQPQSEGDASGLPSFITGGGQPQQNAGTNGHDGDRFNNRRRRRHHRDGAQGGVSGDGGSDEAPLPEQSPQPSD